MPKPGLLLCHKRGTFPLNFIQLPMQTGSSHFPGLLGAIFLQLHQRGRSSLLVLSLGENSSSRSLTYLQLGNFPSYCQSEFSEVCSFILTRHTQSLLNLKMATMTSSIVKFLCQTEQQSKRFILICLRIRHLVSHWKM